eukprot:7391541-Prymnesium_polylepis.3
MPPDSEAGEVGAALGTGREKAKIGREWGQQEEGQAEGGDDGGVVREGGHHARSGALRRLLALASQLL